MVTESEKVKKAKARARALMKLQSKNISTPLKSKFIRKSTKPEKK